MSLGKLGRSNPKVSKTKFLGNDRFSAVCTIMLAGIFRSFSIFNLFLIFFLRLQKGVYMDQLTFRQLGTVRRQVAAAFSAFSKAIMALRTEIFLIFFTFRFL